MSDSSGMSDFLSQVGPLLLLTCAAGVLWVGLMAFIARRASERRRRAKAGLPPLPAFHVTASQRLKTWFNSAPKPAATSPFTESPLPPAPPSAPARKAAPLHAPAPDLSLLTGNLAAPPAPTREPDLAALFPVPAAPPAPAASAPAAPAAAVPAPEPEQAAGPYEDVESLADTFAVEPAAESAEIVPPNAYGDPNLDLPAGEGDTVELLRAWRDLSDGALVVEVGRERFDAVTRLRDPAILRRFKGILGELLTLAQIEPDLSRTAKVPAPGRSVGTPGGAPPLDTIELLRVWRDLTEGTLRIEMKGQRYASPDEMTDPDVRRRFVNVVRELDAMARVVVPPAEPVRPAASAPAPAAPASPAEPAVDKPRPRDTATDMPAISLTPGSMLRQMGRAAMGHKPEHVEEISPLNIAQEIETLLQTRLGEQPAFRQREIHVKPALTGGVRIEVDGQFYDGISEVKDEAVRALLTDVVREWESRQ